MLHDLRCALRGLHKSTALVLALALGLGLTTTIFSIVNSWLLQPLAYPAPDRLVLIWESDLGSAPSLSMTSDAAFHHWRRENRSFEHLAAVRNHSASLTAVETPESPLIRLVSASYFPLIGVEPLLGRAFSPEDEIPGGPRVVILSHSLWQRQFGGDHSIVGRAIELDYEPYEVVGVLPGEYLSPIQSEPPQLWVPLALNEEDLNPSRRYLVYGRLAIGTSLEQARMEMEQIGAELRSRDPDTYAGRGIEVERLHEVLVSSYRPALGMLFGAAACVLLIACCNAANLMLARVMVRSREMAMRAAVGASRWLLVRQLLIENLIFAFLGSLLGLPLAFWGIRVVVSLIPQSPVMPRLEHIEIDAVAVFFAFALAIAIGIVFSLVPAYQLVLRAELGARLRAAGGRLTAGRQRHVLRGLLVVLEVGFALTLLIGTGLMVQTFFRLQSYDPGFDPENLLTLRTGLREPEYSESEKRVAFFRQAIANLRAVPGVVAVGAISRLPPSRPLGHVAFEISGDSPPQPGFEPKTLVRATTPSYFEVMSIPLVQGRFFTDHDDDQGPLVAMVSRTLTENHLKGRSAIGQILTLKDGSDTSLRIVGVVDDVRTLDNPPHAVPVLYLPHAQKPVFVMSFAIRATVDPTSLSEDVLQAVGELDRLMPSYRLTTMARTLERADWQPRFSMFLLSVFAVTAIVLAVTGIYAVMSSVVAERTQEFGIRIVVGATAFDILRAALRHGMTLAALGLASGSLAALALTRFLESQLYGVARNDPATYLGLTFSIGVVALLASSVASLGVLRLDPVVALRHE